MAKYKFLFPVGIALIILTGLFFRLYNIFDNQFLFYDEGMYIGYNRTFLNLVANNPAHNFSELMVILSLILKSALNTPKALWFFILNLRVFIFGPQAWFFARLVSAVSGLATVVLLYFWSRRYLKSSRIAALSALLLLILPSHVFYSRLGMQESLSTLLFLGAIYLYMSQKDYHWQFFVSIFLLVCVYFTNYRMIIAPVFIAFIEAYDVIAQQKKLNWQRVAVFTAIFYGAVLLVGGLYGGVNNYVNFAWMTHQAQDAGGKFNPVNFVSFPYYVFALEGFFFACFFWGNLYFVKIKQYSKLLPFGIVVFQMLIFSFAAEKGARYLCVVLPFMAAAAAVGIDECWQGVFKHARGWVVTAGALAVVVMIYLSGSIAMARTDYDKAVQFITDHDPQAVIVSTQPLVEGLFLADDKQIVACPQDVFSLVNLYQHGARYLILDPQIYISWTANGRRFSPPLDDFLEITLKNVEPIKTFPHLDNILLNRFVLDHNEQIMDSLTFLSRAKSQRYGVINIYDLSSVLTTLKHFYAGS